MTRVAVRGYIDDPSLQTCLQKVRKVNTLNGRVVSLSLYSMFGKFRPSEGAKEHKEQANMLRRLHAS